ncbi:S-layer homology domain-containing protein [Paenibacillus uliginis N3/975]|uniref:S-layer homology domain-containing protein n=1 Tax=Paenibacillus uliginis N3/975 TaxID=1313296 RepID=A0A1X7GAZ7_9BACL|nr:S-layer homology domain-containing protein [Paenibacillus uliginis]SMF67053.1 S-layer homology domain-containing protein [Paenibacillus uliginis N3/975]
MQRTKKPIIWLMMVALVVSLIPAGLTPVASAADKPTSYFTPDISELRNTVDLTLTPGPNQIARDKVYKVTESQQTITGTYRMVTDSTLGANVQLLNWDQTNNRWVEDPARVSPAVVTLDTERPDQRFKANVTLYPGMNRITFTGQQGQVERSETFYVLFDQVPYVEKLQVLGGSDNLDLNEGAQIVVNRQEITLQGKAMNTTKVTVSINGGQALSTSLLQDGSFFSPQLKLNPGVNNLKLVAQNGSDSLTFNYSLFYFDEKNPVVKLDLVDSIGNAQSMLGVQPVFTEDRESTKVHVQMLIPQDENKTKFSESAEIKVNDTKVTPVFTEETFIPNVKDNTPSYWLVSFDINDVAFKKDANGAVLVDQNHTLSVTYGTKTVNKRMDFQFMRGQTVITDLKYLKGYEGGNIDNLPAGEPLNGAKVNSGDFYILVTTNGRPDPLTGLTANYLPLGTSPIRIEYVASKSDTSHVYKVVGLKNGNQTVRFNYNGSTAYKDATISFASKNYIYVENLIDGQTYTLDSGSGNSLAVKGQYIDFEDTISSSYFLAEVFVNGKKEKSTNASENLDPTWLNTATGAFHINLNISMTDGPLVFGENKIILTGTGKDEKGQAREIRKELRIYIVDNNVSTVKNFQPALGKDRPSFPPREFSSDDPQLKQIFNLTPEFIYNDNKYTTSLNTYDLVLRGSGAVKMNLNIGTKNILSVDLPVTSTQNETVTFAGDRYSYDFAGNQNDFIMRVQDLTANAPGTHVYTLELINETGAKTTQRLELVREVSAYRILSPQPTVGKQIVVNKNFVRFDIEAEGATEVLIGKDPAVKRTDLGKDRFVYDYVGLKQDKSNKIKITINRAGTKVTDTIEVFYTGTVGVDAQFMAPKVATKYTVFNKELQLSFPKGTVMQSTDTRGIAKYYPDTKLLFGIAEPITGIVERRNDYGNVIGFPGTGENSGIPSWSIPDEYLLNFGSTAQSSNFSRVSQVYWISGGLGEAGDMGSANYTPRTNGLAPYSVEGLFGDPQTPAERKITPSKRGTLTLSFNPNVVDAAGTTITVYRYTSKREWQNIGGEVDMRNHTVTVPFDEFGYYKVMKLSRGYNDITNHNWARNILNGLYSKGFMNNLRFEQFGTDDHTTRGEFATLLVKGLSLPINSDENRTFVDLVPGARSATWDYDSIETAARAGIVTGLTDGVFGPDQPLTREQAAVMIARALKLKLANNDAKLDASLAKAFVDSGKVDKYARPAVMAVSKAKIMEGSASTPPGQKKPQYSFNPKGNLTRAEAGKIAVELLKKSTNVFPKNLS